MKKYREDWDNDIARYIFKTYEHTINSKSCCINCALYKEIRRNDFKIEYINKENIHFDDIEKRCKHICIYYY